MANRDSEIDLISLLRRISKAVKKRKILIIIFLFLGIGIGIILHYTRETYYSSEMVANSNIVPNSRIKNIIERLKQKIEVKDIDYLSDNMDISPKIIKNIINIEFTIIDDESFHTVLYEEQDLYEINSFKIKTKFKNKEFLDSIEYGINYYLNNQKYIKEKFQNYKASNTIVINEINKKIQDLENILPNIDNSKGIFSFPQKDIIDLIEKKELINKNIEKGPISIILDFSTPQKPSNISIAVKILISIILSLIFVSVLIIILELSSMMKNKS